MNMLFLNMHQRFQENSLGYKDNLFSSLSPFGYLSTSHFFRYVIIVLLVLLKKIYIYCLFNSRYMSKYSFKLYYFSKVTAITFIMHIVYYSIEDLGLDY